MFNALNTLDSRNAGLDRPDAVNPPATATQGNASDSRAPAIPPRIGAPVGLAGGQLTRIEKRIHAQGGIRRFAVAKPCSARLACSSCDDLNRQPRRFAPRAVAYNVSFPRNGVFVGARESPPCTSIVPPPAASRKLRHQTASPEPEKPRRELERTASNQVDVAARRFELDARARQHQRDEPHRSNAEDSRSSSPLPPTARRGASAWLRPSPRIFAADPSAASNSSSNRPDAGSS